jgi:hypothetical protein
VHPLIRFCCFLILMLAPCAYFIAATLVWQHNNFTHFPVWFKWEVAILLVALNFLADLFLGPLDDEPHLAVKGAVICTAISAGLLFIPPFTAELLTFGSLQFGGLFRFLEQTMVTAAIFIGVALVGGVLAFFAIKRKWYLAPILAATLLLPVGGICAGEKTDLSVGAQFHSSKLWLVRDVNGEMLDLAGRSFYILGRPGDKVIFETDKNEVGTAATVTATVRKDETAIWFFYPEFAGPGKGLHRRHVAFVKKKDLLKVAK